MSLATRCAHCGTVFRVVQDQLKVSEGWVRCGRCDQVFNALEGLFDLDRDPLPEGPGEPEETGPPAPSTAAPQRTEPPPVDPSLADRIDEQLADTRRTIAAPLARRDETEDFADARFPEDDLNVELRDAGSTMPEPTTPAESVPAAPPPEPAPEFVRQAEREERWRRPGARAAIAAAVLLAGGLLAAQVAFHERDLVAARWPATAPALALACEAFDCTLQPPRRLDELSVESTSLAPASGVPQAFRLSVVLRNRSDLPAAAPWIDLTLTDATGQRVARRALSPADFRLASATLTPDAETQLQAVLGTGELPVSGYTVEIFYP